MPEKFIRRDRDGNLIIPAEDFEAGFMSGLRALGVDAANVVKNPVEFLETFIRQAVSGVVPGVNIRRPDRGGRRTLMSGRPRESGVRSTILGRSRDNNN